MAVPLPVPETPGASVPVRFAFVIWPRTSRQFLHSVVLSLVGSFVLNVMAFLLLY
jgi:hypothetical protein